MSMLKRISKLRRRSRQPAEGDASSEAGETSEDSSEVSKVDFIPPLEIEKKMPTYFTMGNLAKECLIRGFEIGIWHLECTMRSNNLSTYSIGKANPDLNSVSGGVGMREKFGSFSLAQAWQTDGLLGMIGANSEVLGAGVYSVLKGFYGPHGSAAPKVELLAGFERAPLKSEIIIPVLHSPKFMGYLLLQPIEHFLFGGRLEFDVEQRQIDMHALCVGYVDDTTEYMLKLEKFKDLRGSVFQRLGDKWAVALKANLFGENMKAFTVGGQYQVDEKTLLKARISDDCQVGFVCQIKVTDNIEGIYYFGFDGNSPMSGDHKVGISWSFKA